MNENNYYSEYSENSIEISSVFSTNIAFAKSYLFMFLGTFLTLIVGVFFSKILQMTLENSGVGYVGFLIAFFVIAIVQIVICYKINKEALQKQSFAKSLIWFLIYSVLTGFMFSFLFIYFDIAVLNQVFFGISIYFLVLSLLSFLFRKKIHKASGFAYMGLVVLLIVSALVGFLSWFMYGSELYFNLYLAVSILGIIVFSIMTMVDVKAMYRIIENSEHKNAASIAAAFSLYLDFMNIVIYLLRILLATGNSRSRRK